MSSKIITLSTGANQLTLAKPTELLGLACRRGSDVSLEPGSPYKPTLWEYDKWVYSELGCARKMLVPGEPPVLEMLGRRWLVSVNFEFTDIPSGGTITFVEVDTAVTPWVSVDPENDYRDTYWFGQPTFIQSPVFPQYGGRAAYPLLTIESGWGDSGNENVFVAFDPDNTPVGIYHEYSCC